MLEQLRPDMRRFESFEEACDALSALDAANAAALAANGGLTPIDEDESEEEPDSECAALTTASQPCCHVRPDDEASSCASNPAACQQHLPGIANTRSGMSVFEGTDALLVTS